MYKTSIPTTNEINVQTQDTKYLDFESKHLLPTVHVFRMSLLWATTIATDLSQIEYAMSFACK